MLFVNTVVNEDFSNDTLLVSPNIIVKNSKNVAENDGKTAYEDTQNSDDSAEKFEWSVTWRAEISRSFSSQNSLPIVWCFLFIAVLILVITITVACVYCFYSKKQALAKSKARSIPELSIIPNMPQEQIQCTTNEQKHQLLYNWYQNKIKSKSMWVINPTISASKTVNDFQSASTSDLNVSSHKRPQSTIDLDELYAKVNFSKKLRNRMSNHEAAIIALSRSKSFRSQHMSTFQPDDSISVIYDERTAL